MTTELASPLHDKLGQELKPGVWIFYGHNTREKTTWQQRLKTNTT